MAKECNCIIQQQAHHYKWQTSPHSIKLSSEMLAVQVMTTKHQIFMPFFPHYASPNNIKHSAVY